MNIIRCSRPQYRARVKPGSLEQCHDCPKPAFFLCDYPKVAGRRSVYKACDRPMCTDHASYRGGNRHYCPLHAARIRKHNQESTNANSH